MAVAAVRGTYYLVQFLSASGDFIAATIDIPDGKSGVIEIMDVLEDVNAGSGVNVPEEAVHGPDGVASRGVGRLVAPRMLPPVLTPSRVLPLGLGRQAQPRPLTVRDRVSPGDHDHGQRIALRWQGAGRL